MSAVVPMIAAGLEAQAGQATAPTIAPARAIDPAFAREDRIEGGARSRTRTASPG